MIILICGSRDWTDRGMIWAVLREVVKFKSDIVVHGGQRGADQIGGSLAKELGVEVRPHYADWKQHGRAAGPIRNQEMLDQEHPDLVLAFHDDLIHSKGTKDMVQRAKEAGVPVRWFRHKEV